METSVQARVKLHEQQLASCHHHEIGHAGQTRCFDNKASELAGQSIGYLNFAYESSTNNWPPNPPEQLDLPTLAITKDVAPSQDIAT